MDEIGGFSAGGGGGGRLRQGMGEGNKIRLEPRAVEMSSEATEGRNFKVCLGWGVG
jgi:hypothetical protein